MKPKPRRQVSGPADDTTEWVGGTLLPPFFITEGEPYRPALILWMDLPSGLVVGHHLQDPKSPVEFGETLIDAMERPLVGPPRRPRRVRVASPDLADSVRRAVGDTIRVVVAATPELDDVLDAMKKGPPLGDDGPAESYLEQGRVSAEVVADLFRAGEVLYRMAPWSTLDEEQLIRVDVPRLGVTGACLSVIGGGQNFGLVVFPSLEAFEAFASAVHPNQNDGRLDLGTPILSLNFERRAELPPSMRREIAEHGWTVAGPRAYPVLAHRDRDGVPRPLTERDFKLMTAVAATFVSFFLKNKGTFQLETAEPVSESYSGRDGLTVRVTYPYEAFDLFESGGPGPAPVKAAAQIARNAPCPCGSGLKYKKCHLAIDEAKGRAENDDRHEVHEMDERVVADMQRFAARRFGRAWQASLEDAFEDFEREIQLASPWSVYCARVDGRTIVDWYLDERGQYLAPDQRDWLQAQQRSWLTIWEILDVNPGHGMRVRDLLTGLEPYVSEVKGSRVLVKRDAVIGRLVDHNGVAVFCGMHPNMLQPIETAQVVDAVRARLRRKTAPPPARLREEAIQRFMIKRWEDAVADRDLRANVPPQLTNTDGEPLEITTDVFTVTAENRGEVDGRLRTLAGVEGPEHDDEPYVFLRDKSPSKRDAGRTVIANALLNGAELTVETNSVARADDVRARVENACRGLLIHTRRQRANPLAPRLVKPAAAEDEPAVLAGGGALVRAFKERHYRDWADQPIPALQGKTPREAIRTAKGRAAVDVLLRDFENHEQRQPPEARVDFAAVRRDLHLPG